MLNILRTEWVKRFAIEVSSTYIKKTLPCFSLAPAQGELQGAGRRRDGQAPARTKGSSRFSN